jgi:predicted  nucleic acid-binding Zn-ribbon protein
MAQIIQPHAKREEFICGGCQMGIPLQKVNAILGTDDIQTCDVCGRILYLEAPAAADKAAAS